MNKEELKELAATLNGIADGKAWECMWGEGFDNPCGRDVDYCLKMRIPIRLKPWSLPLPQPDPYAELKAAHAAGKKLQCKMKLSDAWLDFPGDFSNLDSRYEVRIKPEQQKVPLGPSDVPPGSVLRRSEWLSAWQSLFGAYDRGVSFNGALWEWDDIIDTYQINRSIPLTGKWNPEAWEPCYKLIDTP